MKSKNNNKKFKLRLDALLVNIEGSIFLTIISFFIYTKIPHFRTMLGASGLNALSYFFFAYLVLNIGYFIYAFIKKFPLETTKMFLISQFVGNLFKKKKEKLDKQKVKTAFLSTLVKFFFFPIMFSAVIANLPTITDALDSLFKGRFYVFENFNYLYNVLIALVFFFDTLIFAFGYSFEARELKNEIKSVEPTFFGWFIALIAYPPFNKHTSDFLQGLSPLLFGNIASSNILTQIPKLGGTIFIIMRVATLICYIVYVWATFALGAKSSNLTNRGIVTKGPYRVVRHPAYVAKNLAWWIEGFTTGVSLGRIVALAGWNVIYFFRAKTEEAHLGVDPDYKKYITKVKWKFIPGIA